MQADTQYDETATQDDGYNQDEFNMIANDESTIYDDQLITNTQVKKTKTPYVNYAKTAKRVDVRKLKDNLWKALTIDPTVSDVNGGASKPTPPPSCFFRTAAR
jgi:condensin complex subunit 2